jgi:hypothetical protein
MHVYARLSLVIYYYLALFFVLTADAREASILSIGKIRQHITPLKNKGIPQRLRIKVTFKCWLSKFFLITHTSQYHLVVDLSDLQFLVRVLFNSLNHSGVAWPKLSLSGMLTSKLEGILTFKGGVPENRFGPMSRIHSVPELGSPKSGRYFIVNESNI